MNENIKNKKGYWKSFNNSKMIENTLTKTGLDANWLELEITESIMMQDIDRAIKILNKLKKSEFEYQSMILAPDTHRSAI